MELRNLITFIQVSELGSFTRAAEELGYSQSTISFQIKQLEEELGCLLFERINHTVTLTERGEELVSYAHRIIALNDEFKESLSGEERLRGHVRIVAPDSVCEELVSAHYMGFRSRYPDISVRFSTGDTGIMLGLLDRNEADLIITLDGRIYNNDYIIAAEKKLPMHFVCSARSPLAKKKEPSLSDIIGEPFILTERGQGYRRVLDRELAKRSLEITPILEIGRTDVITKILAESDALSYLPDFVTEGEVASGRLCRLEVKDMSIDIWKQLIYHKNKWMSGSLRAFIDYIIAAEFC